MKNLYLLLILFLFTSCEKFVLETSDVTLMGLYVVDYVDVIGNNGGTDTSFHSGQVFDNTIFPVPFNKIKTNDFNINFENNGFEGYFMMIWTNKKTNPMGKPQWLYDTRMSKNPWDGFSIYGNTSYNLGALVLKYTDTSNVKRTMTFIIERDGSLLEKYSGANSKYTYINALNEHIK
jgi:hypothetical protein